MNLIDGRRLAIVSLLGPAVWACFLAATPVGGEKGTAPVDSAQVARFVDSIVNAEMTRQHVPGAAFVFVQDGRVLYLKGYGVANVETAQPVDPARTIWRIGSISKVFTANAVVQLADRGRLDLNTDVNRYLKRLQVPATYPTPITIANLLTHTSGLDEIRPGTQGPDSASVLPLADFLRPRLVRVRKPGALIAYSTYGITLAGQLIEEVSGLTFERYLADNIWHPLRMDRTNITVPPALKGDVAMGYEYDNGVQQPQRWEWYHTTPASSINSTASDMARWMLMHLQYGRLDGATIMSERAARDMQRGHATGHPKIAGFAYGFNENLEPGYPRFINHGGKMAGFSSELLLIPERQAGFFIVHQGERANIGDPVKWALLERFYGDPATRLPIPVPSASFTSPAQAFLGRYAWDVWCRTCSQPSISNVLQVSSNPEGTLSIAGRKWVEVEPLYFVREDGKAALAFGADSTGQMKFIYAGGFWVFERIP